ncbi:MAG: alkaline phosphatase D family protein [Ignavibacteriaceae bacterium]
MKNLTILLLILVVSGCGRKKPNDFLRLPMVGIIQNSEVPILIKTISEGKVRIEYKKADESSSTFRTNWKILSDSNAFSTNLILNKLNYDTEYKYRVEFDDGGYSKWFSFKTFPTQGAPGKLSIVFSSCMREKYMSPEVYNNILKVSPTFVALLGDQMYGDYDGDLNKLELYLNNDSIRKTMVEKGEIILNDKTVLEAFRSKYRRAFIKDFQKIGSNIPIIATWDDHDYGQDNSDGTYHYKYISKKVFNETYPAYPFAVKNGGLYYKFTIADVDVFVLDDRWYRSPMQNADSEDKTMHGEEQLSWLLTGLKQSTAPFKIIFSGVSMNDYGGDTSSDRGGEDNWVGYKFERNKILSFIQKNYIKGVMVFSGDQHYPSAHILNWKTPLNTVSHTDTSIVYSLTDLGTAVFDFCASPLNYKRATGFPLLPENQKNPLFSYEIFRANWANPGKTEQHKDTVTSIYDVAEIDTKSSPANVVVKFFELNKKTSKFIELYSVKVTY